MDKARARELFETACATVREDVPRPKNWQRLNEKTFLEVYCGVVFAAGFRASIVDAKFPEMKTAFKEFDPVALARMRSISMAKLPIKHEGKAKAFLKGAKQIHQEGWKDFKNRIEKKRGKKEKLAVLMELPGIGSITKYHLAKDTGLVDTYKPDIWLRRCAEECSTDVCTLVAFLCEEYHKKQYEVDYILFKYRSSYVSPE